MDTRRRQVLAQMGITAWQRRAGGSQPGSMAAPVAESPDLDGLRDEVRACTRCALHQGRTQTVFGVGNPRARLLIVGEAPGAEEDRRGEPFVGRAGQLLDAMLMAIGVRRQEVYIANIIKCRPPRNRDPQAAEVAACDPYLQRQIELVAPRVLLAVGRVAAHALLGTEGSLARLRGRRHQFGAARLPLLVTYHPAYLLRTPADKSKSWADLQQLRDLLETA